jgi:hypothetical protein
MTSSPDTMMAAIPVQRLRIQKMRMEATLMR